ncbi:MAG: LamG domain-containing protein, partial [Candidatus Nealsonbacteria bacterium]
MEGKFTDYISLQEAVNYCNYTQEYLSLRARQGKLKAVKFGRNWVTRKEWLDEYSQKIEEYNVLNGNGNRKKVSVSEKENVFPPKNLPVVKSGPVSNLRFAFSLILVFVLLTTNSVFGKISFQNVFNDLDPYVKEFALSGDMLMKQSARSFKNVYQQINSSNGKFTKANYQTAEIGGIFQEYGIWISDQLEEIQNVFVGSYKTTNYSIENVLGDFGNSIVVTYKKANESTENSLRSISRIITSPFKKLHSFFSSPPKNEPENIFVDETTKKDLENLRQEVEELKEEGLVVKETVREVSRVVEPIKEITRQTVVNRIDNTSLSLVNSQIAELQTEMTKRLYAPGGVISQQIYITEPVASPKIYQEDGDIVLQTAGTGNVILSAATGMQIAGQQVVIDSTSILNPLVYIADKARIAGDTVIEGQLDVGGPITVQRITLTIASSSTENIIDAKVDGETKFSVDSSGDATLIGDFTITGSFTQAGAFSISTSSSLAALTVNQSGTGNIVEFQDEGTSVFTIADGGDITATGNLILTTGALYQPVYGTDDGLVLYLPFSEGYYATTSATTTTVYDRSPYGNDGTVYSGATGTASTTDQMWVDGKYGQALSFDGTDDYVNVSSSQWDPPSANATWEMWFKPAFTIDSSSMASKIQMVLMSRTNSRPNLYFFTDGALRWDVYTGVDNVAISITTSFEANRWYYVVATWGSSGQYLYIDGLLEDTDPNTAPPVSGYTNLYIGERSDYAYDPFNGTIDEVRIYNRALSANEIRSHYLRGQTTYGLVQADSFRIIDTSNTVNFQLDGSGNAVFTGSVTAQGSTTQPQLDVRYDTSNLFTVSVAETGITTASSTGDIIFVTATTENMRIASSTGFVGIATSSPRYALDIYGGLAVGTGT